jgi:protein-L-isoaspartate(D-aspartate) O-methyltransferase
MTGKAEQLRERKPDPANPQLVNGSFEEEPNFQSEGGQPGWYYERLAARRPDERAPDGKYVIEFKNDVPNLDSHLLQGFPIDGRKVAAIDVSAWVKTDNVVAGQQPDQAPYVAITLYDEQRRQLEPLLLGPLVGTSGWREVKKTFQIPREAREGIFRIGLFGATGAVSFDKLALKKKSPQP